MNKKKLTVSSQITLKTLRLKEKIPSLNQEEKEITLHLTTSSALDIRKGRCFHLPTKKK